MEKNEQVKKVNGKALLLEKKDNQGVLITPMGFKLHEEDECIGFITRLIRSGDALISNIQKYFDILRTEQAKNLANTEKEVAKELEKELESGKLK